VHRALQGAAEADACKTCSDHHTASRNSMLVSFADAQLPRIPWARPGGSPATKACSSAKARGTVK
jgi:hypothetical protein